LKGQSGHNLLFSGDFGIVVVVLGTAVRQIGAAAAAGRGLFFVIRAKSLNVNGTQFISFPD
jgi:hypothetical protein